MYCNIVGMGPYYLYLNGVELQVEVEVPYMYIDSWLPVQISTYGIVHLYNKLQYGMYHTIPYHTIKLHISNIM